MGLNKAKTQWVWCSETPIRLSFDQELEFNRKLNLKRNRKADKPSLFWAGIATDYNKAYLIKPKCGKVKCPLCKKKYFLKVKVDMDGEWYGSIPSHKKKVKII